MAGNNCIASHLWQDAEAIADSDQRLWTAATYHFDDDVRCRLGVFGDASSKDWLKLGGFGYFELCGQSTLPAPFGRCGTRLHAPHLA